MGVGRRATSFFTVLGLGVSVVVSMQLLARVLDVLLGIAGSWAKTTATSLFGGLVGRLSLWVCHGLTWLKYRRRRASAPGAQRTG